MALCVCTPSAMALAATAAIAGLAGLAAAGGPPPLSSNATPGDVEEGSTLKEKMENTLVTSSVFLGLLLLSGHVARRRSRWLRALHLGSSLLGGVIGWIAFVLLEAVGLGEFSDAWFAVGWNVLPGFCTTIVFSCLFLGTPVPPASDILLSPRREHLIYGLMVVFGQYAVSSLLTGLLRLRDPTLSPSFATVLPYGYAGGPVVAEAMQDLYEGFGYPEGYTLALLAATLGMFAGVIAGAVLVNLAPISSAQARGSSHDPARMSDAFVHTWSMGPLARLGQFGSALNALRATASESDHHPPGSRPSAGEQTVAVESLDSLMFHLCLVAAVMAFGYILRFPVVAVEEMFSPDSFMAKSKLLSVLPLFLFCLLGGLALQKAIDVWGTDAESGKSFVDRATVLAISNTAQDILIVSAIARLGRNGLPPGVHGLGHFASVILERGLPFFLVCAAGMAQGVLFFWYAGPRLLPSFWAERALVEFGVSIGATSTGLLLLRMADPEGRTPVLRDFTFKQIFHVLLTGGGFFDVLVPIPLTAVTGSAWPLFAVATAVLALLLLAHPVAGLHRVDGGEGAGAAGDEAATRHSSSDAPAAAPPTSGAAATGGEAGSPMLVELGPTNQRKSLDPS